MDKRKALGHNNAGDSDDGMFMGPGPNRLPGPYPHDRYQDAKPDTAPTEGGNPAIGSNRPIANMEADVGSGGCIKKGVAFCYPMGEPGYDDPDYN